MPTELDALIATIQEKHETARRDADRYGLILGELRKLAAEAPPAPAGPTKPTKRKRKAAVRPKVSAADAILRLLNGCKMGLPSSEVVKHVTTTYGHQANSIGTTLYMLKKKGKITPQAAGMNLKMACPASGG